MSEWRLFEEGTVPEYATAGWYAERDHAPHLEQAAHYGRLMRAAELAQDALGRGATSFSDLGAGDGGLLSLLGNSAFFRGVPLWGYDLQPSNVEAARRRQVDVRLQDALGPQSVWGDCVIATEFLEHLVDPHHVVEVLGVQARWLVASSPYTESADSHYEFHLWAWDQEGYRSLMEQAGWRIIRHELVDIFQVILCESR